jgi:hypothetical protein
MIGFLDGRRRPLACALLCGLALLACRKPSLSVVSTRPVSASPAPAPAGRSARIPVPQTEMGAYPFTAPEKAAVEEFLRLHPDLRLAADADRQDARYSHVRRLYGVYHPYFVRGDLNDDGVLDFVLAFVRRDRSSETPWFSIVVFTGREDSGGPAFSAGTFIEKDVSLARGDLSIDRDAVLITPDLEDESVRRYRWDPLRRSYMFVRDDDEEEDTPIPSRT